MKKSVAACIAVIITIFSLLAIIPLSPHSPAYATAFSGGEQAVPAFNCHNLFYDTERSSFDTAWPQ